MFELLNENQYSGASILSRWEFTIRLAMQGSRSHAGSSSRRRVMAAMAGLMAHRGHNPVSKPPATIAPPLQAPSRHTRARTHTHIHTHTQTEREREREGRCVLGGGAGLQAALCCNTSHPRQPHPAGNACNGSPCGAAPGKPRGSPGKPAPGDHKRARIACWLRSS